MSSQSGHPHQTFADALSAFDAANDRYIDACDAVWVALRREYADLAVLIEQLGLPANYVPTWVCHVHPRWGMSPADMVAEGRVDELRTLILQSLYGIVS